MAGSESFAKRPNTLPQTNFSFQSFCLQSGGGPYIARRVCRRQAPPEASGRNLWKGTQTCFGGGVHTSKRRVSGFREGERASEGRGCTWRGTLNARQKGKPEGSLPVQLISHGTRLQKDRSEQRCRPQNPEEERKGN